MSLGSNIKKCREEAGLTQSELAERAGITQQALAALENRNSQSSRFAAAIAHALGLTVADLILGATADNDEDTSANSRIWPDELVKLITLYGQASDEGRRHILQFARETINEDPDNT